MSKVHSVLRYKVHGSSRVRQVTAESLPDARADARSWLRRQPEDTITGCDLRVYEKAHWDAAKASPDIKVKPLYQGDV